VSIYTNQVGLYSTDNAVLCKSFSVALRGSALEWFMSLPPYTIDSFTTLTTAFTTQFDTSHRHDLTMISLLNLEQEEGEPLRTFIDRFGAIAMKIKDLTPNLILTYMMTSLRPGPFADELAMRSSSGMQELKKRAVMFIRVEDMRRCQNSTQSPQCEQKQRRPIKNLSRVTRVVPQNEGQLGSRTLPPECTQIPHTRRGLARRTHSPTQEIPETA